MSKKVDVTATERAASTVVERMYVGGVRFRRKRAGYWVAADLTMLVEIRRRAPGDYVGTLNIGAREWKMRECFHPTAVDCAHDLRGWFDSTINWVLDRARRGAVK